MDVGISYIEDNKCQFCKNDISKNDFVNEYIKYSTSKSKKVEENLLKYKKELENYKNNILRDIKISILKNKEYSDIVDIGENISDEEWSQYINDIESLINAIEKNVYSDTKNVNYLELISKKYPNAIFTMDSAFYFHNLTDVIPSKINLAIERNSSRIKDEKINQVLIIKKLFEIGKMQMTVEGATINVYDKERMLIELIRNKNQIAFDYYKEIISNYRKIINDLDISKIEEYIERFPHEEYIYETLQREVF